MSEYDDVRLPAPFDDLAVGIIVHHPETGEILDVNSSLTEMYGYTEAQFRSMRVSDFSSEAYAQAAAVEAIHAAASGERQRFDWQVRRANGELIWVKVHLRASTLAGKPVVLAEIRDVTEYVQRQDRLDLHNRVVRHNLRNDMNVISGYAGELERELDDERLQHYASTIAKHATKVATLRESLERLERITQSEAAKRVRTNLAEVIDSVLIEMRKRYPEATLRQSCEVDAWVNTGNGFRIALAEAVENGVEHNDQPTPTVVVSVVESSEPNRIVVEIADDGPPIPDTERRQLLSSEEVSSTVHGSGVGIWVITQSITALGGKVDLTNNEPRGNRIRFELPRTDPPRAD